MSPGESRERQGALGARVFGFTQTWGRRRRLGGGVRVRVRRRAPVRAS